MIENQLSFIPNKEYLINIDTIEKIFDKTKTQIVINENINENKNTNRINNNEKYNAYKKQKKEFLLIYSKIKNGDKIFPNKYILFNISQSLLIFSFLSLINLFTLISSQINERTINLYNSEITIKIRGIGAQKIINPKFEEYPNEIYEDEIKIGENISTINLIKPETYIRLKWFNQLTNCNNMFQNLTNILYMDLSKFDSSEVTTMFSMFHGCESLTSINFTNFDTSKVIYMNSMFAECKSLSDLDISNFNTSKVTHMNFLFGNCISLKSLDLSNFDTSLVVDMGYLFYNCWSLSSIDLTNFNTSLNGYLDNMFYNCSFRQLNLSSFDTSNVALMDMMFFNCTFLEQLNLPNFDTSLVTNMNSMFFNCSKLNYVNIINFKENDWVKLFYIFDGVPENIVYCVNEENSPAINEILKNKKCSVKFCGNDWENKQKKLYLINNEYECEYNIINDTINSENENTEIIYDSNYYIENTELINDNNNCNENDFYQGKCNDCTMNIDKINYNLTNFILPSNIYNYINETTIPNYIVNHYFNTSLNYTITIFNKWQCTNLLLEYDFFEINPAIIYNKLNTNLNPNNTHNNYIFVYINHNYKNYIEIYNPFEIRKINIELNCPECFEENNLIIKNNFTSEIYNELGPVIMDKIIKNNIDPFNKDEEIFNNICKNFTVREIDIPIKERKEIIYLKLKEKELICNDINCTIENYYMSNLTGICKCKISTSFDYLLNYEFHANENELNDYYNFINSKLKINSFLIFKCGKEAFNYKNIKINIGFFISIVFLLIQLALFFIMFYLYEKKENKNGIKLNNPPKIQKFEISNDLEEEEEKDDKNNKNKTNKKIENDEIMVYINSSEGLYNNDNKENINIKQKINNINKTSISRNGENNNNKLILLSNESNTNINNKINHIQIQTNNKKRSLKNLTPVQKEIFNQKESLIKFQETKDEEQVKEKEENIEIKKIKTKSFIEYYWKLLSLKQQIINLLYPIKFLKIENSYIPVLVKLMRIILVLSLNIFFNIFHLDQKYFREKYKYFNQKYNIIYIPLNKNISLNERFKYGFKHSILSGFISFIICLILETIFDFFIFNIKRKINRIKEPEIKNKLKRKKSITNKRSEENVDNVVKNNESDDVYINLVEKEKKKYLIFFGLGIVIMMLIFYSVINFNEVYKGGISDLIPGTFWSFIFLQISPFIYCIFFALYMKYKDK